VTWAARASIAAAAQRDCVRPLYEQNSALTLWSLAKRKVREETLTRDEIEERGTSEKK